MATLAEATTLVDVLDTRLAVLYNAPGFRRNAEVEPNLCVCFFPICFRRTSKATALPQGGPTTVKKPRIRQATIGSLARVVPLKEVEKIVVRLKQAKADDGEVAVEIVVADLKRLTGQSFIYELSFFNTRDGVSVPLVASLNAVSTSTPLWSPLLYPQPEFYSFCDLTPVPIANPPLYPIANPPMPLLRTHHYHQYIPLPP
jgi:hypothetical protein